MPTLTRNGDDEAVLTLTSVDESLVLEALQALRARKTEAMTTLNSSQRPRTDVRPFTEHDMGIDAIDRLFKLLNEDDSGDADNDRALPVDPAMPTDIEWACIEEWYGLDGLVIGPVTMLEHTKKFRDDRAGQLHYAADLAEGSASASTNKDLAQRVERPL